MVEIKFIGKSPIDNLSKRCCWCYEINLKRSAGIHQVYAIGIPDSTPVYDPQHYNTCGDYKIYDITTSGSGGSNISNGKKMIGKKVSSGRIFQICFISKCEESDDDVEISLHKLGRNEWGSPIDFEGSGRVPFPVTGTDTMRRVRRVRSRK